MEKSIEAVIQSLVNIPDNYHRIKTKSVRTLLQESGYFEVHDRIHAEDIREVVKTDPEIINKWLRWSEDQRSTPTWYFTKGEDGKCYVGHYPEGKEFEEISTSDEFKACAAYIKKEIESLRTP